jgi:hypothetical protein
VTLCRLSNTVPIRVSTIERKTLTCLCESATHDKGFPISRQFAAVYLDLLGAPKSVRHPTSQTICPDHPHSSHPHNGPSEGRYECHRLIFDGNRVDALTTR